MEEEEEEEVQVQDVCVASTKNVAGSRMVVGISLQKIQFRKRWVWRRIFARRCS